jgi:transposase InsO family protein
LSQIILIPLRFCDNGLEFKGAVQTLIDSLSIPIIRGRSYHPQTQALVELLNGTFKDRLASTILEIRKKDWVDALPGITETINTTRPSGLPSHITLYKV